MGWMANFLTRRNNIYEPEFRLFGSIPAIILDIIWLY